MSNNATYGTVRRGLLKTGFSAWLEVEGGLCGVGDTAALSGVSVACWMNNLLFLPFSWMVKLCVLTSTIGKGPVVLTISFFYAAVTILSLFFFEKTTSGGMSM